MADQVARRRKLTAGPAQAGASSAANSQHSAAQSKRAHARISFAAMTYLAACCLPVLVATYLHDADRRPSSPALARIDKLFRHYGSVLPFLPWVLRLAAFIQLPTQLQDSTLLRHPGTELMLHLFVLVIRWLLYILHVMGQKLRMWSAVLGGDATHLFADHVVLGEAVQASLVVELAAAAHLAFALRGGACARLQKGGTTLTYVLLAAAAVLALYCSCLVSVDLVVTAQFFHDTREVVSALVLGLGVFGLMAGLTLYEWIAVGDV